MDLLADFQRCLKRNYYDDRCWRRTRKGHRCTRKAPEAGPDTCWQHQMLPDEVRCSTYVGPWRDIRCSRLGLYFDVEAEECDAGYIELYCMQHWNMLQREHGRAEVVSWNRRQQEERRKREEERERLHPRRRSPRLVAREAAAAAANPLNATAADDPLAAGREQRRVNNRANQSLRRSARIAARRSMV